MNKFKFVLASFLFTLCFAISSAMQQPALAASTIFEVEYEIERDANGNIIYEKVIFPDGVMRIPIEPSQKWRLRFTVTEDIGEIDIFANIKSGAEFLQVEDGSHPTLPSPIAVHDDVIAIEIGSGELTVGAMTSEGEVFTRDVPFEVTDVKTPRIHSKKVEGLFNQGVLVGCEGYDIVVLEINDTVQIIATEVNGDKQKTLTFTNHSNRRIAKIGTDNKVYIVLNNDVTGKDVVYKFNCDLEGAIILSREFNSIQSISAQDPEKINIVGKLDDDIINFLYILDKETMSEILDSTTLDDETTVKELYNAIFNEDAAIEELVDNSNYVLGTSIDASRAIIDQYITDEESKEVIRVYTNKSKKKNTCINQTMSGESDQLFFHLCNPKNTKNFLYSLDLNNDKAKKFITQKGENQVYFIGEENLYLIKQLKKKKGKNRFRLIGINRNTGRSFNVTNAFFAESARIASGLPGDEIIINMIATEDSISSIKVLNSGFKKATDLTTINIIYDEP